LRSSSHQVQRRNGAGGNVKGKRSNASKNKQDNRRLPKKSKEPEDNLLQFLFDEKDFSDIFELVVHATLAGFLETGGIFTLFAPSNNAFKNLPPGTNDVLFKKNKKFLPHLTAFVANHLHGAELHTDDIELGKGYDTFGDPIQFNIDPLTNDLLVNGIVIEKKDEQVKNGIVHEIDTALSPSWVFASLTGRVAQIAQTSTFSALIIQTGIDLNLAQSGEFTLLAPVNDAFGIFSENTVICLLDPLNVEILKEVLLFHVLKKEVLLLSDFEDGEKYKTLSGGKVKAKVDRFTDPVRFEVRFEDNALVVGGDVLANNGVVHVIDTVLDPETVCAF
jgi:transforming growth factor-beta-induced protein